MEQVAGNMGLFEGQPGAQVITMRPDLRCKGEYEFCREDAAVEHYSRRVKVALPLFWRERPTR